MESKAGGEDPASLDARFGAAAPFGAALLTLPYRVYPGRGGGALCASGARVAAWLQGWARAEGSPLRPALLGGDEHAVLVEPFGERTDPVPSLLAQPWEPRTLRGTRGELLGEICQGLDPSRALAKALTRRRVDRFLDREVELHVRVGTGFGGLRPAWWRQTDHGPIALRCDLARPDAWLAMELAGLAIDGEVTQTEDPEAFALASIAVLLREGVLGNDPALARRAAALVPEVESVDRVRVWIEGPPFIDGLWERNGAEVSARRGRWLLQHVDGVWIAGARVAVRTAPELRRGRRPPRREPAKARRRELFARWHEGIEVDDEGLFGLTPEALALRIAAGARGVVIDGTCGAGAISIALARQPDVSRVVAVDVDAGRLAMARHNARVYGVEDRVEWVCAEAAVVVAERRADLLVLDPPWGGRAYDRERVDLDDFGMDVAAVLARFDGPVRLKLPRSFDPTTLPGEWALELMLDVRGFPKLLLARRG